MRRRLVVGLLGPLTVALDGRPVMVTTSKVRTLLAVLAISTGRAVPVDRLAAALWPQEPPENARRSVQTYVTRLRSVLGAELVSTTPAGYVLHADPGQVDALRFVRLLEAAGRAPDRVGERERLTKALALWRGTPFEGIRSDWLACSQVPQLWERYLSARERRIDLDLADGRHGELVHELDELIGGYPLRESLWVRLLVALDRRGRPAEALERYERIRIRLAEELGVDPGPELRQVHADLLAGRPPHPTGAPAAELTIPHQLPADIDAFAGRDHAIIALDELLHTGGELARCPARIVAITGTAGVGKSALAIHWGHRLAGQFPGGQLYADLRDRDGWPLDPGEVVRGFLVAFGVLRERVPSGSADRVGLYRSMLAGKRVLVMLDNAHDADQVRPLLPGSPGCLAVVTSRSRLTGLVAAEGARPLALDLLPAWEARQLLAYRLGKERVDSDPAATDQIVAGCAKLPLALAIVAARAADAPTFPLATLARELCNPRSLLDALTTGDPAADVRTAFSWSLRTLSPGAAGLFRSFGRHPGPHLTAPTAAWLAGCPASRVRPLLMELTHAHLLGEPTPGQYTCHRLLRAYAAELARPPETDPRVTRFPRARELARSRS